MTVDTRVPIVEYTGNGVVTKYDWDWYMIEDSNINVLVNNTFVFNWTLQGTSVVFDTPPEEGDEIIIYRITTLWMPEDYRPFGRFHSEKTELSMDRAIMICQERGGRRGGGHGEGIVGGANLHVLRGEFDLTIVSERGTDAKLLMWNPDGLPPTPPGPHDPSIIWAGDPILAGAYSLPNSPSGIAATIRFRMDLVTGDPTEASCVYPNYNVLTYTGWLDADPADDEYWMRVTESPPFNAPPERSYQINDGDNFRTLGEEFPIRGATLNPNFGPYVSVHTYGETAPITVTGTFNIEICKDDGGVPDGKWASRIVTLEAIFNV